MKHETVSFKPQYPFHQQFHATVKFIPNWFERLFLGMQTSEVRYTGYYDNWFCRSPFSLEKDKDVITLLNLEYYFAVTQTTAEQLLNDKQ